MYELEEMEGIMLIFFRPDLKIILKPKIQDNVKTLAEATTKVALGEMNRSSSIREIEHTYKYQ